MPNKSDGLIIDESLGFDSIWLPPFSLPDITGVVTTTGETPILTGDADVVADLWIFMLENMLFKELSST